MAKCQRSGNCLAAMRPLLALALLWPLPSAAGFYVGAELAAHNGPALNLRSGDNDRPARCDEFANPRYAEVEGCTAPDHSAGAVDDWKSVFDRPRGPLGGVSIGYRLGDRWRFELEGWQRSANVDETALVLSPDAGIPFTQIFGAELPTATERIDKLQTRGLFANAYHAWPNDGRLTPFVGLGVGIGYASMEYAVLWQRSADPRTVQTAQGLANEDEVRRNLAGTASRASDRLQDQLAGWQLLGGVDYALTQSWSLAVQARWVRLAEFEDGGSYDELRGHVSNLRLDGSEPVVYRVTTEDAGFFSIGLRLQRQL